MIITENFWFPEDNGLDAGSTAGYGNTLKANMDKEGNVSYMIGFIGDLLDINNARPEDANLNSKEGAQAAFEWWYQSNSQSGSSCTPSTITPYVQVDDGDWQQTASVTVDAGTKVKFGPQPIAGTSWSWSGGGTSSTTREQTVYPSSSLTATATFTNTCGAESTQNFTVSVNQDPNPNPNPSAQIIENGRYNIASLLSGLYLDVYGARMADGTTVIQYPGNGEANQQFDVEALGDGTYSIRAAHSGKAVEVYQGNVNDGAELRQSTYTGGQNQRWRIDEVGDGVYSITSALSNKVIDVWELNTTAGGEVKLYRWLGGSNQQWSFVQIGDSPNPAPSPEPTQCSTAWDTIGDKGDGVALTPPMGWNSWNVFHENINEQQIKQIANAMVSSGMKDAGYQYINLDDNWMAARQNGKMMVDRSRFPNGIDGLADYIHGLGLKLGIY
ncbi:MAG: RICIN domain-containing protein, partial [Gammaproteobacteria bacterium]